MWQAAEPRLHRKIDDLHGAIISDLVQLIECVRTSMELIGAAVAREAHLGYQETASNAVVLDDVTPGYVRARGIEQLRSPSWSGPPLSAGYRDTATWFRCVPVWPGGRVIQWVAPEAPSGAVPSCLLPVSLFQA
jgi:hypothetical protein